MNERPSLQKGEVKAMSGLIQSDAQVSREVSRAAVTWGLAGYNRGRIERRAVEETER